MSFLPVYITSEWLIDDISIEHTSRKERDHFVHISWQLKQYVSNQANFHVKLKCNTVLYNCNTLLTLPFHSKPLQCRLMVSVTDRQRYTTEAIISLNSWLIPWGKPFFHWKPKNPAKHILLYKLLQIYTTLNKTNALCFDTYIYRIKCTTVYQTAT